MRYTLLILSCFLFVGSVSAERICVVKKPRVTAAGRVNMVKAIRFTTDECSPKQFELAIPAEPVKTSLPSGETITGFYALGGTATAGSQIFRSEIDFQIALDEAPVVEVLEKDDPRTSNCTGTASAPTAIPGVLCIYEGNDGGSTVPFVIASNKTADSLTARNFSTLFIVGTNAATKFGAEIRATSIAAGSVVSSGTWAVTGSAISQ